MEIDEGLPIDRIDAEAFEKAMADLHSSRKTPPQPVFSVYPRNGIWTGNNQLGFEIPFDTQNTDPQTVLKLDEWGFPEVWTVSLYVSSQRDLTALQFFEAMGRLQFGSGGVNQTIDVDWVNGTMLSLPFNALNVKATSTASVLAAEGIKISVILSRGSLSKSRATRTFHVTAFDEPSEVEIYKIPPFSRSAQVLPVSLAANAFYADATAYLVFYSSISPNIIQTVQATRLGPNVKVPIPSRALYWSVFGGAAERPLNVIFNLIDE